MDNRQLDNAVILSDCQSALRSIQTGKRSRPVILSEIQKLITEIDNMGISLHLEWIPLHIDIRHR